MVSVSPVMPYRVGITTEAPVSTLGTVVTTSVSSVPECDVSSATSTYTYVVSAIETVPLVPSALEGLSSTVALGMTVPETFPSSTSVDGGGLSPAAAVFVPTSPLLTRIPAVTVAPPLVLEVPFWSREVVCTSLSSTVSMGFHSS